MDKLERAKTNFTKPNWLERIKKEIQQKSSEINWDLIELDAAVAIAVNDNKEFRKI